MANTLPNTTVVKRASLDSGRLIPASTSSQIVTKTTKRNSLTIDETVALVTLTKFNDTVEPDHSFRITGHKYKLAKLESENTRLSTELTTIESERNLLYSLDSGSRDESRLQKLIEKSISLRRKIDYNNNRINLLKFRIEEIQV